MLDVIIYRLLDITLTLGIFAPLIYLTTGLNKNLKRAAIISYVGFLCIFADEAGISSDTASLIMGLLWCIAGALTLWELYRIIRRIWRWS